MTDSEAIEQTGLLVGLTGEARAERAELVGWLLEQCFSLEQLRAEPAPMLLPANRALGDDGSRASAREISESHGVDMALLQRIERAMGLPRADDPDAAVQLRADAEAAARWQQFIELGLDPDQVVLLVRRLAEGLSHAVPAVRYSAISAVLRPGYTELQLAQAYEAMVRRVAPLLGSLVCDMLFVQLRHAMEGEEINASERAAGTALPGARRLAVAFADMVGFTRLGEAVAPEDLVRLVERLAELAHDIADPPVRLVKTLGDAVMLVCPDPARLVGTMLELAETADRDDSLPELRIGVAWGWAVSRARDWFGSPVNVASRVTGVAQPGMVLVSGAAREAIGAEPGFTWSFVGAPRLKGVRGETKLFEVRRSSPARAT
ncbi:MAG TPA: adenylate/guanylate cyclase domain-containing protein [Mycobacterium sp.]|nr:adenylate/guanylate cyclase domain-containing protein [Mycobacterium sp.]